VLFILILTVPHQYRNVLHQCFECKMPRQLLYIIQQSECNCFALQYGCQVIKGRLFDWRSAEWSVNHSGLNLALHFFFLNSLLSELPWHLGIADMSQLHNWLPLWRRCIRWCSSVPVAVYTSRRHPVRTKTSVSHLGRSVRSCRQTAYCWTSCFLCRWRSCLERSSCQRHFSTFSVHFPKTFKTASFSTLLS